MGAMELPAEGNGRATIREVHDLLRETRRDNEAQLSRTEERLMSAIYGMEARILDSIGPLSKRVAELEAWRDEVEHNRAVQIAEQDGRMWFPRMTMLWLEQHWKVLTVVFIALSAILTILLDIDYHPGV